MNSGPTRLGRHLRGPLLTLVVVLIAVILVEFALLARLGERVLDGQGVLSRATRQQVLAFDMELNTRDQDTSLFRYLRTGDEVHLERLAEAWTQFNALSAACRHSLEPNSPEVGLLEEVSTLAAEADTLAGVLIMLRQHKADTFEALHDRIERAQWSIHEAENRSAAPVERARALQGAVESVRVGVSENLAMPSDQRRDAAANAIRHLRETPVGDSRELTSLIADIGTLAERVLATQDDEDASFLEYSAVLRRLSEDLLSHGLRQASARRQMAARENLRLLAHRTVLRGLLIGACTALLGLIGGLWLYRHAVSAHEHAQRFQTLIDNAPFSVLLSDDKGTVTYANPATFRMFGIGDPRQIVGQRAPIREKAKAKQPLSELFARALGGETVQTDITLDTEAVQFDTSRTGTLHLRTTLFPTEGGEARDATVVTTVEDITERVRAQQAKASAELEMEKQRGLTIRSDRLRSLGQMAAGMAHELNQPLVGVRGLAEHIRLALERGWEIDETVIAEKTRLIIEQADRMEHIIEHVRMFAREAGKPEVSPVSVNDVVRSSLQLLGTQLKSRGVIVQSDLADDLPPVTANPFSLEEVVINLIVNARDAVEDRFQDEPDLPPPHLTLATGLETPANGRSVTIEVTDRGTGVPGDLEDKIFDPFVTTKGPHRGTGLGLSIARAIVEDFGGEIRIRPGRDTGTSAIISMPPADSHTAPQT